MKGYEDVCWYSSFPQYWGKDPEYLEQSRGNPELLAELWGIPLSKIDRYHLQWGKRISESLGARTAKKMRTPFITVERTDLDALLHGERAKYSRAGKAYDSDNHEYGDYWQMLGFLRALGGARLLVHLAPRLMIHLAPLRLVPRSLWAQEAAIQPESVESLFVLPVLAMLLRVRQCLPFCFC
ncbi:MAG: hypothetical protein HY318_04120 [Armatimonadetes bacterium]|nr:hypothetical protein [Armatimonadota bacterium]